MGKVANAGVESTFRDAYIDGKLVTSDYAGGQSLAGAALNGSVAGAAIGGGAYAAAKALRPTRINSEIGLENTQGQGQGQLQGQQTTVDSFNPTTNNVTNTPAIVAPEEPKHWAPKKK